MNNWIDKGDYLGFWKDKEYYIRNGQVLTFKIGTLLISLTDLSLNTLISDFNLFLNKIYPPEQSNRGLIYYSGIFADFLDLFNRTYNHLSSTCLILGDTLLNRVADSVYTMTCTPQLGGYIDRDVDTDSYVYAKTKSIYKTCGLDDNLNLGGPALNIDGFRTYLMMCNHSYDEIDLAVVHHTAIVCIESLNDLETLKTGFSNLVSATLIRQEPNVPSMLRFKNIMDRVNLITSNEVTSFSEHDRHLYNFFYELKRLKEHGINTFSEVVSVDTADDFDETHGYRFLSLFDATNTINAAYQEYAFICANTIEIVKCKNCGRFFLPLTAASSFCDRPIDGDYNRTCKSISAQWYVGNRRSTNPAWDEYILYRNRYNTRTSRNKTKNPKERLERWNRWARQLIQSYDNGELSQEDVSKALKEMDDHMKPLDKM